MGQARVVADFSRGTLKIISGGQTGVDRGALDAALALGISCGGWCPANRLAEDGRIPERYPVTELADAGYAERTARNVADSDGTLFIAIGALSGGTLETEECCVRTGKPHLVIDAEKVENSIDSIVEFLRANRIQVLNVAGPRASQWPPGHDVAKQVVSSVLRRLSGHTGGGAYSA